MTDIDVMLFAGGLGTRMRGVSGDAPKELAPIAGRAFLGHLLDYLAAYGARRVVLCLGHLADHVTAWLAQGDTNRSLDVVCQIEPRPLGSAAALGYVRKDLSTGTVMVMSGNTFLDADLRAFVASHRLSGADASVLCVEVEDAARFGRVEVGPDSRVRRFIDKTPGRGVINAGVYLFSAAFLDRLDTTDTGSLTRDVLHKMPPGTLHAHIAKARFIDLGTPESLAVAASVIGGRDT
ncbi:sugar phosphate nucleotidyltransferase [Azospirillum rugosum]|uniref:Mannose-1-phosphate guanylyltransferase n=1 Tax=Azospirillum rugosum TaxID=416170 RepID=A0ABS4SPL7_9PROT|nr:sugar phosphate nucleotidyltransferase [Azospirillum rugosum]MBP2294493.1 mannose-1-phosphate guanylyltransferase [Azospirillum rugosum]MDQ0528998.1 mannose-1-phosphate guanylyltransferase [Azospirillum rugosum]